MPTARTLKAFVGAAITLLLAQADAHADYLSATVPLISQQFGATAGTVVGEANNGTTAMNGLLPGQVRLTFTANPLSVYTQNGPGLGFAWASFHTDLSLSPSQISVPAGWSVMPGIMPQGFPLNGPPPPLPWDVTPNPGTPGSPSVAITISGLGNVATLSHFLPPAFPLAGQLDYPGAGGTTQDDVFGRTVGAAPEPSTLAMAAACVAGIVITRQRGQLLRRA